ncbi:hypothetical protein GCM10020331_039080 [Ectobacillus funiculus]
MKRNPLIPFALIAALGIALTFLLSFQGLYKAEQLADAEKKMVAQQRKQLLRSQKIL